MTIEERKKTKPVLGRKVEERARETEERTALLKDR